MSYKRKYGAALWKQILNSKESSNGLEKKSNPSLPSRRLIGAPQSPPLKKLPRIFSKRDFEKRIYSQRRKWFLIEKPFCKRCQSLGISRRSESIHHTHGRRSRLLLYGTWWVALCNRCHEWVHKNINEARIGGWICPVGQWNVQPK